MHHSVSERVHGASPLRPTQMSSSRPIQRRNLRIQRLHGPRIEPGDQSEHTSNWRGGGAKRREAGDQGRVQFRREGDGADEDQHAGHEGREIPLPDGGESRPLAEEFGAVVTFLCSNQASYITGSMIRVDGGMIRGIG